MSHELTTCIGTKLVRSQPMTRQAYNNFRGWPLQADENGADEGYLVEYLDGGAPNTKDYGGYVSWSPKAVFDSAYRPISGMTFGMAIEALKSGLRVSRAGWNGKDMWLALSGRQEGHQVAAGSFWSKHNADYAYAQPGHVARVLPCITMKTATGEILMGWLASQTDMLAEDWGVV